MRLLALIALTLLALPASAEMTVAEAMDDIVTRLYASKTLDELYAIDQAQAHALLTPAEREALATRYWHFEVDVPVVVSLIRDKKQAVVPFWITEAGFQKTDLEMNNEHWNYEVWQKDFPAGHIGLGTNGLERHRIHYLVAVGPQRKGDTVTISKLFPEEWPMVTLRDGAHTYNDWSGLKLENVPEALTGHTLLTSIRGRARETALVGGFRKTEWPSSPTPDQVALTWSEDPTTTQTVQWRTSTAIDSGKVLYRRAESEAPFMDAAAEHMVIENRFLANDRYCHHFTATLRGLTPGVRYEYRVGTVGAWSGDYDFITAPDKPVPFSFIWFGDTHNDPVWGQMIQDAFKRHPGTAFFTIAGDVVDTGQWRDDWDQWFDVQGNVFAYRPVMPSLGNHDTIEGLGAQLYRDLFGLPLNGPKQLKPERAYSFEYSNALFLILDSQSPAEDQADWMEEQLKKSDATWKFAVYHFPPYNYGEGYPDIAKIWGDIYDRYHVDMAFEGHIHYYMRSKPFFGGKTVDDPNKGTIHVISIGTPNRARPIPEEPYAVTQGSGKPLYQAMDINGKRLVYRSYDKDGNVQDQMVIEKD
jgi:hypothetical protein